MKKFMRSGISALALAAMFGGMVFAHHGRAGYGDKITTVKGTVTGVQWKNPHVFLEFDVKDDKGNLQHWAGELTSPYNLAQGGWTKKRSEKELLPGTELTIELWPSKAGTTAGVVTKITNSKGEQILLGRAE